MSTSDSTRSRSASRDRLAAFERRTAAEDRETRGRASARRVEELVAPLDRRAQRRAGARRLARRVSEERQPLVRAARAAWTGSSSLRARGGELDRERQAVEPSQISCGELVLDLEARARRRRRDAGRARRLADSGKRPTAGTRARPRCASGSRLVDEHSKARARRRRAAASVGRGRRSTCSTLSSRSTLASSPM